MPKSFPKFMQKKSKKMLDKMGDAVYNDTRR